MYALTVKIKAVQYKTSWTAIKRKSLTGTTTKYISLANHTFIANTEYRTGQFERSNNNSKNNNNNNNNKLFVVEPQPTQTTEQNSLKGPAIKTSKKMGF